MRNTMDVVSGTVEMTDENNRQRSCSSLECWGGSRCETIPDSQTGQGPNRTDSRAGIPPAEPGANIELAPLRLAHTESEAVST